MGFTSGSHGPINLQRLRRPQWQDDEEDSDEDLWVTRGLNEDVIEGRTVEHVYRGASGPSSSEPSESLQASPQPGTDENKCMICMELFADGDMLRTLPCLHRYHRQCVDQWLNRASTCPICKRDVTDTSAPVESSAGLASSVERPRTRNFLSGLMQRATGRGARS